VDYNFVYAANVSQIIMWYIYNKDRNLKEMYGDKYSERFMFEHDESDRAEHICPSEFIRVDKIFVREV
jgi:hypothetical protein